MKRPSPCQIATVGQRFPTFELRTCRDRPVTLEPRSSIVIFYRGHWCGHCRDQLTELARESATFRALPFGLIAISADDLIGANDMYVDTSGAIEIYSDPSATAIQTLQLADRDDQVDHIIARPTVFVVDENGLVRYRYVSRTAADRPTSALLALAAESLVQTGGKGSAT